MAALSWMVPLAGLCGVLAIGYWIWRRQSIVRGLGLRVHWWTLGDFGAGVLISLVAMLGIFAVEWALGGIVVEGFTVDAALLVRGAQEMMLGAAFEEVLSRMLQLNGFQIAIGLLLALVVRRWRDAPATARVDRGMARAVWPAVAVSAVMFGYIHISNPGGSWFTAFGNALGGLMYGIAFLGGRNLWLPLGLHFGWNYVQGVVLGFPVSGLDKGGIVLQHPSGESLLFGGAYGPEGGVVGMMFRFVVIALLLWYLQLRCGGRGRLATLEFPIATYLNPPRR